MYTETYEVDYWKDPRGRSPVEEFLSKLPDKARRKVLLWLVMLYVIDGRTILITQAFLKKTPRVPPEQIALCRKRRADSSSRAEEEERS